MSKRVSLLKQLWRHFLGSFEVAGETASSHPLATLPVLSVFFGATALGWHAPSIGLTNWVAPTALTLGAGTASITAWFLRRHFAAAAALQLIDIPLYGLAIVSLAVFSQPPASYVFLSAYVLMCIVWATQYGLNLLSVLSTVIVPSGFALFFRVDPIIIVHLVFCLVIYSHTAYRTTVRRRRERKLAATQDVIRQVDKHLKAANEQRKLELASRAGAIFHELRSELGMGMMNWRFASQQLRGKAPNHDECEAALNEAQEGFSRFEELFEEFRRMELGSKNQNTKAGAHFRLKDIGFVSVTQNQQVASIAPPADEVPVKGDLEDARVVLRNLLQNGYDAGASAIELKVEHEHDRVRILVTDDGKGLAPPVIEHLFEPLVTADKKDGTGLGLYLSKKKAVWMGGDLRLVNTGRKGTTFELELPKLKPDHISGSPSSNPPAVPSAQVASA